MDGKKFLAKTHDLMFRNIHGRKLIYNTCWEDPRIDRELLRLGLSDRVVMITSAGCNALDYLLDAPAVIHAIDMNPRQNALLELKMAMFHLGDFEDLFQLFGIGCHKKIKKIYQEARAFLSDPAREFWDGKTHYFADPKIRSTFYYHGAAGSVAWLLRQFLKTHKKLRDGIFDLVEAESLEEQRAIYEGVEAQLWGKFVTWLVNNPLLMALLGVPRAQIKLIKETHPDGIASYARACLRHIATEVPMADNYFWRVYVTGSYTQECCPNYLKKENFEAIRCRLEAIRIHTCSVTEFLRDNPGAYTRFVLLDHQDWLSAHDQDALAEEWRAILANAAPHALVLMRSASHKIEFIPEWVSERLAFNECDTKRLAPLDRVGTYASTLLAGVPPL